MKIRIQKLICILLICISLIFYSNQVFAGLLDDFEKDATKGKGKERTSEVNRDRSKKSLADHAFDSCFGSCVDMFLSKAIPNIFGTIVYLGKVSWYRADPDHSSLKSPFTEQYEIIESRESGQALVPFSRLDTNYQNVSSDVEAFDYRAELGYGPFGFQARNTHYKEDLPERVNENETPLSIN